MAITITTTTLFILTKATNSFFEAKINDLNCLTFTTIITIDLNRKLSGFTNFKNFLNYLFEATIIAAEIKQHHHHPFKKIIKTKALEYSPFFLPIIFKEPIILITKILRFSFKEED